MMSGVDSPPLRGMRFEGNLAANFKEFRQRLDIYISATGLDEAKDKRKISILLNYIGDQGIQIYNTFNCKGNESLEQVLTLFEKYFSPKKNLTILRNEFFCITQNNSTLEDYFQRVINLGNSCEFGELRESLTVSKIIAGLDSKYNPQKSKLMTEDDGKLTLQHTMQHLLAAEASSRYLENQNPIQNPKEEVLLVNKKGKDKLLKKCYKCGTSHQLNQCPAYGKICYSCNKRNHFTKVCRNNKNFKKQVNLASELKDTEDEEEEGDFFIGHVGEVGNEIIQEFTVKDKKLQIKMDTGAACNVIGSEVCKQLCLKSSDILPCDKRIIQLDGKSVPVRGTCWLDIIHPNKRKYRVKFIVIHGNVPTLLGCRTCLTYNFVSVNSKLVKVHNVRYENSNIAALIKVLKTNYSELFDGGLGCIPGQVHIQLSRDAVPTIQASRRVPFSLLPEMHLELKRMERLGVIEKITKPTKWVNNLVSVRKPNGKLRMCLDPRALNKYIVLPKYQLPTLDEIKSKMQDAKYFALLDASNGFWMLNLDNESSDLCTFITPFGRYRYKRLPFGISSAPEEFSRIINQMFENIDGVIPYIDDLCVYAQSIEELNNRIKQVMDIAMKNGIKFNESKCKFFETELLFLGHKFTEKGVYPDPSKVQAVMNMENPKNKKDLERFLGMCNYLSRFIPNYSKITEPLRILMKKDAEFTWDCNQDTSVEILKKALCSSPCLAYFNTNQDIILSVDSSSTAMGAVIIQDGKPIAYGSRSLTSTEQNYCQLEKEMLAIVFGCYKMHQYTYGRKVHVETDHKPLETLFKKPLYKVPARLQRMMLAVQGYNLEVKYKPGRLLFIADTLSRSCTDKLESRIKQLHKNIICHVKLQRDCLPVSKLQLKKIQTATESDHVLKNVIFYIKNGWPKSITDLDQKLQNYWTFKDELCVLDGIVLKSNLILIPESMKPEILRIIHQGHAGISTCKIRARSCVFWPDLNRDLEVFVKQCNVCAKFDSNLQREPLLSHDIEKIPWHKVGIDICTQDNKDFLILMDYYSKYIEVCKLDNLSSDCVISNCKSVFARHGIPVTVISDGGPQFTSEKFNVFVSEYKFEHIRSSPRYPQSNGQSESGVKIFKNIFKKCKEDGSDLYLGLLNYRNTPKPYMPSPAQLLFSRTLNSLLPIQKKALKPKMFQYDEHYYNHLKSVKKSYDKRSRLLPDLEVGQQIYFKKSLDANWTKGKIIQICKEPRSYIVGDEKGNKYRRNRKFIKLNSACNSNTRNSKTTCSSNDVVQDKSNISNMLTPHVEYQVIPNENANDNNMVMPDNNLNIDNDTLASQYEDNTQSSSSPQQEKDAERVIVFPSDSIQNETVTVTRSGRRIVRPRKFNDYIDSSDCI